MTTRRQVLTLIGAGAVAGCAALPGGAEPPTVDAKALAAVVGEPPTVSRRVPVAIAPSHLAAGADRVRTLLADVPTPLDASEVPNGVVRRRLHDRVDRAHSRLSTVDVADTPLEAMLALRDARAAAGAARGGWRAIDDGLTRSALDDEARAVDDDRRRVVARRRHRGTDPVDAVLLHARIETAVSTAARLTTSPPGPFEPSGALGVAERAGDVEHARAAVDDAAYLDDRYAEAHPDVPDRRPAIDRAVTTLQSAIDRRRARLPDDPTDPASLVDRDVEGTPAATALRELGRRIDHADGPAQERDAGRPARAILRALTALARLRALDALRTRIADGEPFAVDAIDAVDRRRTAAVDAVRSSDGAGRRPSLAADTLAEQAAHLRDADRRLDRFDGRVRVDRLTGPVATYVVVAAVAGAVPEAVAPVVDALEA